MTEELKNIRLRLRKLITQSQHEAVSWDGLGENLRQELVWSWGKVYKLDPEHQLDVEWIFNKELDNAE